MARLVIRIIAIILLIYAILLIGGSVLIFVDMIHGEETTSLKYFLRYPFYLLLFSISLRLISAIAITAAGVTATLAYRFVIENLSPKTGFFRIFVFLFFLFLAATIGIFIINVAEAAKPLSSTTKKICIIVLHALIIAAAIYVIVW